jgi:hypothetical protein
MANLDEAFNAKFDSNILKLNNHNDDIDYFFTQRKVTEFEDFVDQKNMERKKKKKELTYNFIAINVPYYSYLDADNVEIDIKIWGDEQFKYSGTMTNKEGYSPGLLLKLNSDKQLFINLKLKIKKAEEESEKEYVTFINIPKRYQIEPTINS